MSAPNAIDAQAQAFNGNISSPVSKRTYSSFPARITKSTILSFFVVCMRAIFLKRPAWGPLEKQRTQVSRFSSPQMGVTLATEFQDLRGRYFWMLFLFLAERQILGLSVFGLCIYLSLDGAQKESVAALLRLFLMILTVAAYSCCSVF